MFGRTKIAMLVGEFLGVVILTTVILAVANSQIGFPLFIASAAGLTAGAMVLTVGWASGAQLNPAITASLWTVRKITTTEAIAFIASQLLGGLAALSLYEYITEKALPNIASKHFEPRVFLAEAVGSFIFGFGVTAAFTRATDSWNKALIIGSSLTLGMVAASIASNGVLNPAVAIGLRSVSRSYVLGPLVGAIIGANVYNQLFAPIIVTKRKRVLPTLFGMGGTTSSVKKKTTKKRR